MTLYDLLAWAFTVCLLGGLAVVIVYAVVRGASFAYFRTKLEFLIKARRLKKNGEA